MSPAPGTRLGVCEITGQIGAGGMGEVYRATGSNLKRQVGNREPGAGSREPGTGMPLDEALPIAKPIAEGVDVAHDRDAVFDASGCEAGQWPRGDASGAGVRS